MQRFTFDMHTCTSVRAAKIKQLNLCAWENSNFELFIALQLFHFNIREKTKYSREMGIKINMCPTETCLRLLTDKYPCSCLRQQLSSASFGKNAKNMMKKKAVDVSHSSSIAPRILEQAYCQLNESSLRERGLYIYIAARQLNYHFLD